MSSLTKIPLIAEISKCDSIYISQIIAPMEGVLQITLGEGGSVARINPEDFSEEFFSRGGLSQEKKPRRNFELKWNRCIAYVATDETYAPNDRTDDQSTYSGRWFQTFEKSHFLRFIAETTYAVEHHSLALEHIRIATYNWIVDVASDQPPEVSELESDYR